MAYAFACLLSVYTISRRERVQGLANKLILQRLHVQKRYHLHMLLPPPRPLLAHHQMSQYVAPFSLQRPLACGDTISPITCDQSTRLSHCHPTSLKFGTTVTGRRNCKSRGRSSESEDEDNEIDETSLASPLASPLPPLDPLLDASESLLAGNPFNVYASVTQTGQK